MKPKPLTVTEKRKWAKLREAGFDCVKDNYGWKWIRQERFPGEWLAGRPYPNNRQNTIRDAIRRNK